MEAVRALFPDYCEDFEASKQTNHKLCTIEYDDEYVDALCLFKKATKSQEKSERVLALIDCILEECEGHYTVWNWRRECIRELNAFECELQWINRYTMDCPKNYQLWYHRQCIVGELLNLHVKGAKEIKCEELEFLAEEFERNPKNYHAWQYRQWLLMRISDPDLEREYEMCMLLLRKDPHNNSVYNHLVFISKHFDRQDLLLPDSFMQTLDQENDSLRAYKQFVTLNQRKN